MDGQKRRRGRPATGRSVDSLEAQKFKRAVWSGSRSRVWLTKRVHQTWEISKRMSLFKTDNDFVAHMICFRWKWSGNGYKHVLHQLALDNNLITLMAISRTPALFARVDLFSRRRVILFTRNNFQLPTKTP